MIHNIVKALLLAFMFTMTLDAVEEDKSRIYVGVGLGGSAYVDSGFAKEQIVGVDREVEENGLGAKLYAGYQINKIIAVEASYVYYGSFKVNESYTYKAQGLSLSGNIGYSFFDDQFRPYVLVGLGYIISDFPHDGVPLNDYSPSLHIGVGATYLPKALKKIGFRVAYESNSFTYVLDRDTVDERSYGQGLGILYLGVEYRF